MLIALMLLVTSQSLNSGQDNILNTPPDYRLDIDYCQGIACTEDTDTCCDETVN